jgi:hypothetical protein
MKNGAIIFGFEMLVVILAVFLCIRQVLICVALWHRLMPVTWDKILALGILAIFGISLVRIIAMVLEEWEKRGE